MSNRFTDKRTVTTDALETLGKIIDGTQKRDAIHLAVEPVIAGQDLLPGDHVKLEDGFAFDCGVGCAQSVGIVDPFIEKHIKKGERFWLVIYPRVITSLRHVWTHPDFKDEIEEGKNSEAYKLAENWMRDFAREVNLDYEILIKAASGQEIVENGYISAFAEIDSEFFHFHSMDAYGDIPPEFWDHMEILTGKKFDKDSRPTSFNCSC